MKQIHSFTRISELVQMAKQHVDPTTSRCNQVLRLIEQSFYAIDNMAIAEREEMMKLLAGWILVEKFDAKGYSILSGFQRYCIADCLLDDPDWSPKPRGVHRSSFSAAKE